MSYSSLFNESMLNFSTAITRNTVVVEIIFKNLNCKNSYQRFARFDYVHSKDR